MSSHFVIKDRANTILNSNNSVMYIMSSFSRFQYENIHCDTHENFVIKRRAIEHCWLF